MTRSAALTFVQLEPWHLPAIAVQPSQADVYGLMGPDCDEATARGLIAAGPCWAGIDSDGRVLGAAGFTLPCATMALAWALFSPAVHRHPKSLVRFVRAQLEASRWRRVEAFTRAAYPEQGRFAEACGLRRVALLRNWGPPCEDMILHERVSDATG